MVSHLDILTHEQQAIFRALADPTRRGIIEILSRRPQSIAMLVNAFDISRPAIAKHLKILEEAGLLYVEEKGRERINHLYPARLKIATDWLSYFNRFWDQKLETLTKIVEETYDDTE